MNLDIDPLSVPIERTINDNHGSRNVIRDPIAKWRGLNSSFVGVMNIEVE
jgi:hypothetical protein